MEPRPLSSPDHTALRVALWRALHAEIDAAPHVLRDTIGAQLVGEEDWRRQGGSVLGRGHCNRNLRASAPSRT